MALADQIQLFPNLRILVVDDDATSRGIIELMLSRLGYAADTASDGMSAVVAVQSSYYDTILMDVRMPLMDGMETTRRIRGLIDPISRPSVLALTGDGSSECRRLCREAGMDGFIAKPLDFELLGEAMGGELRRLGKPSGEHSNGPAPTSLLPPSLLPVSYQPDEFLDVDREALKSLTADLGAEGLAIRNDLIETFLFDGQERIRSMTIAANANDLPAVAFQAHALKSASATLGLYALAHESDRVEQEIAGSSGDISLTRLLEAHRRVIGVLASILDEDRPMG